MKENKYSPAEIEKGLRSAGYEARRPEVVALAGMLAAPAKMGARGVLLEGPPGCGKTALAESVAHWLGAPMVVYQAHAWTDDQELFTGVDVVAAVAGDHAHVRQEGVLAQVARLSETNEQVILLLDELDKSSERAEALLLDWLQSGRVPLKPGVHVQTRLDRVLVFVTSNAVRPLSEALLRRLRRLQMQPLRAEVFDRLIEEKSGCSPHLARMIGKAARVVGQKQGQEVSLQEAARCACDLHVAENVGDVREILAGWLARTPEGRQEALSGVHAPAIWAEIVKLRRGEGQ